MKFSNGCYLEDGVVVWPEEKNKQNDGKGERGFGKKDEVALPAAGKRAVSKD